MGLAPKELVVLKTAKAAFAHQTGIKVALDKIPGRPVLLFKTLAATTELMVNIAEGVFGGHYPVLLWKRLQNPERHLFVLQQVRDEVADNMRKHGIQFIDTAGNGYINQPQMYVFVKGNKVQGAKTPAVNRLFKQTGLRVLYAILCNPGLVNETYRTIAAKTKVALGMVNWVFKDLKELGFLVETGKRRAKQVRLVEKEKLLERWVTAYAEQLRPKLVLGHFRGAEGWWQQATMQIENGQWGGETAAAKLTDYLKPQNVTIYVDQDNMAAVLIQNRLKKDQAGDVEFVARFWQPDTVKAHGDTVHPILVYADLMATGNQRNIETARIIYDEHIVQLIREN